jgi:anti-sigma factor RsiW
MNHEECRHLLGHLSDYVDGDLGQTMCAEIERHLGGCRNCRVVVDTLRQTVMLYQSHGSDSIPDNVEERLYKVLRLDKPGG